MPTKVTSLNIDLPQKQALADVAADLAALRTQVAALVADVAAGVADHNALVAKLNADAGVADTNYAAATPKTSVTPATLAVTA